MSYCKIVLCFFSLLVAITGGITEEQEEEEVILSSADAHAKYRVHVPANPIHESQVPETQLKAWKNVLNQCTPVITNQELSESCISALDEYFPSEPVWDNRMYYYRGSLGYRNLNRGHLFGDFTDRDRAGSLPFSSADFLGDIPRWRDIFDGNIEQRTSRFLQIVNDETCMDRVSSKNKGIDKNLASRCAARELYKYSAYLDACSSATHRLHQLQIERPHELPWKHVEHIPTDYDISIKFIRREIENPESRAIATRSMQRGYLLAYWTVQQCELHDYVLIPGLTHGTKTSGTHALKWENLVPRRSSKRDDIKLLDQTSQRILKIAAKSGDEWAIRSFDFRYSRGKEFRSDVHKEYPILTHRWLGSRGKTENARRHQAKAYLLLKETASEEIARLEYDPNDLSEAILYILDGGELNYPPTWVETPVEQLQ